MTKQISDAPEFGKQEGVEYVERLGAYGIAFNDSGQICVLEENGHFYLPGGGLNSNESSEAGLEREFREELGAQIGQRIFVGNAIDFVVAPNEGSFAKRGSYFVVELVKTDIESKERARLVWLDVERATKELKFAGQRWAVGEVVRLRGRL